MKRNIDHRRDQYLLEQCKSREEILEALKEIHIPEKSWLKTFFSLLLKND